MTTQRILFSTTVIAAVILRSAFPAAAQQGTAEAVRIDSDDLGGVVTGAKGPEAGVWVIAETRLSAHVILQDRRDGRPRPLPGARPSKGEYDVWVRGYGLVDSPKVKATPGKMLNLKAVPAPNPRAAAEYYPAEYWFSLVQPPPKSEFPGTGPVGQRHRPERKKLRPSGCGS